MSVHGPRPMNVLAPIGGVSGWPVRVNACRLRFSDWMMIGPAELVPTARAWSGGEMSNPKLFSLAVWSMPLKPLSPRTFPANPVVRATWGILACARGAFFTNDGSLRGMARGVPRCRAACGLAARARARKLTVPTLVMCTAVPCLTARGWAGCGLACAAVAAAADMPSVARVPAPMRAASARVRCCARDPLRQFLMLLTIDSLSLHLPGNWARGITEYKRKLTERRAYTHVVLVSITRGASGQQRPANRFLVSATDNGCDFRGDGLCAAPGQGYSGTAVAVVVKEVTTAADGLCLEPDVCPHGAQADPVS